MPLYSTSGIRHHRHAPKPIGKEKWRVRPWFKTENREPVDLVMEEYDVSLCQRIQRKHEHMHSTQYVYWITNDFVTINLTKAEISYNSSGSD